jgi:hypothetical protein
LQFLGPSALAAVSTIFVPSLRVICDPDLWAASLLIPRVDNFAVMQSNVSPTLCDLAERFFASAGAGFVVCGGCGCGRKLNDIFYGRFDLVIAASEDVDPRL